TVLRDLMHAGEAARAMLADGGRAAAEVGTFDERLHAAACHRYSGVTNLARWERDAFHAGARWARNDAAARTVTAEEADDAARALFGEVTGAPLLYDSLDDGAQRTWRARAAATLAAAGFTVVGEEA